MSLPRFAKERRPSKPGKRQAHRDCDLLLQVNDEGWGSARQGEVSRKSRSLPAAVFMPIFMKAHQ